MAQSIPPNLLLNFNPYDILLPVNSSPGPRVDKLIDIDDGLSTHATGSLIDQKSNYEPIDLYQNLYVTPKDIKLNDDSKTTNEVPTNIDYKNFLDVLESDQKIDWVNIDAKKDNTHVIHTVNVDPKPETLVPKIDIGTTEMLKDLTKDKPKLNKQDTDPDDLINEVLSEKNMERIAISRIKEINITAKDINTVTTEFPQIKILSTPILNFDIKGKPVNKLTENKRSECSQLSRQTQTDLEITETNVGKSKLDVERSKGVVTSYNVNIESNKLPKCVHNIFNKKIGEEAKRSEKNYPTFQVMPHKINPKVLKKKCIIKSDIEISKYTNGADFKEISKTLPEIMSRISERQAYIDQKNINSQKKRYKTEEYTVRQEDIDKLGSLRHEHEKIFYILNRQIGSPNILMADCNKERLKAYSQGKVFKSFVMGEK